MKLISKYRKEIFFGLLSVFLYFLFRLLFLDNLPIFTDEAIYVRWAQIALHDPTWRLISLTDGKQPLLIWFIVLFMKLIEDPLIAARVVSVVAGFFTMVGLFLLSLELFKNRKIAYLSSFLYIFFPFAQVYDRMALMDGMLGAFSIWTLFLAVLLVRNLSLGKAYTLGFLIGGAILTKSSGAFSVYLTPLTLLIHKFEKDQNKNLNFLIRWLTLIVFAYILSQGFYAVLRLSPFFQIISEKNLIFVYSFKEWIDNPLISFQGNLKGLLGWVFVYLTPSYIILLFLAFWSKNFLREKIMLFFYFSVPFLALCFFGKVIFPRFIYFMALSLIPVAAYGLNFLLSKTSQLKDYALYFQLGLLFLVFSYPAKVSLDFALNPTIAKIPQADINQYINGWPAGWGIKRSTEFFKNISKNNEIFVATQGTFGLLPHGLEIYLQKYPKVHIKGYWPIGDYLPEEVLDKAKKMPTYFVYYQPNNSKVLNYSSLSLEFKERMGRSNYFFSVYKVNAK